MLLAHFALLRLRLFTTPVGLLPIVRFLATGTRDVAQLAHEVLRLYNHGALNAAGNGFPTTMPAFANSGIFLAKDAFSVC